jgi:hypothetical protein
MCDSYERERKPYFNTVTESDRAKWLNYNGLLLEVKQYRDVVFNAMKERTFNDLNSYKAYTEEAKKAVAKKPVVTAKRGRPKTKQS